MTTSWVRGAVFPGELLGPALSLGVQALRPSESVTDLGCEDVEVGI